MSNAALNWAFSAPVQNSVDKFVLVALANRADAEGECFPSKAALEAATALNRKTIMAALKRLREAGWITDTGMRKGATGQVIVYRMAMESVPAEAEPPAPHRHHNGPINGTLTENQRGPDLPSKGPVFTHKGALIYPQRGPNTGPGTLLEPTKNPKGTHNTPISPTPPSDRVVRKSPLVNGQDKGFETWWQAYPRKEAKGAAAKAYAKALTLTDPQTLLDALDRNWPVRKYIPHPATWLNSQRWLDEIETGNSVLRAVMEVSRRQSIFAPPDEPTPRLRIVQ